MRLRILSYNIHKGFNSRSTKLVLSDIREAIRETAADLVFLQEVIGEHSKHQAKLRDWPNEQQFEYLADSIWPHFAYGKNAVYDAGHHGNAILSKFPILSQDNLDISAGKFEQRGILHCRIELPEQASSLDAYCTHLGLFNRGREIQYELIADWVRQTAQPDTPLILAGDFNDWRRSACDTLKALLNVADAHRVKHGNLAKTFPSWLPMLTLDRVYQRGATLISAQVLRSTPWNRLSDHAPILVELEL